MTTRESRIDRRRWPRPPLRVVGGDGGGGGGGGGGEGDEEESDDDDDDDGDGEVAEWKRVLGVGRHHRGDVQGADTADAAATAAGAHRE